MDVSYLRWSDRRLARKALRRVSRVTGYRFVEERPADITVTYGAVPVGLWGLTSTSWDARGVFQVARVTIVRGLKKRRVRLWLFMHEFGHAVGADHAWGQRDVMYRYYRGVVRWSAADRGLLRRFRLWR